MKNLNLENYGVQEMNEKEMMNVDGGVAIPVWLLPFLAGAIAGGLTYDGLKAAYFGSLNSGHHYNGSVPGFGPR